VYTGVASSPSEVESGISEASLIGGIVAGTIGGILVTALIFALIMRCKSKSSDLEKPVGAQRL